VDTLVNLLHPTTEVVVRVEDLVDTSGEHQRVRGEECRTQTDEPRPFPVVRVRPHEMLASRERHQTTVPVRRRPRMLDDTVLVEDLVLSVELKRTRLLLQVALKSVRVSERH